MYNHHLFFVFRCFHSELRRIWDPTTINCVINCGILTRYWGARSVCGNALKSREPPRYSRTATKSGYPELNRGHTHPMRAYYHCTIPRLCCCSFLATYQRAPLRTEKPLVGAPGFEPGVTCTQNRHVSRYTTPRPRACPQKQTCQPLPSTASATRIQRSNLHA